ncbi:heavy metal translocating P-type ATPase [Planctomyces sp. SH-PL14]|uniref:heavy metal translocating P-type ATPase n=1 Tax=Planctomyces sp. SH-PL14 TaxID=1632864 RepID=UPI00078E5534|nr:heavy metal translocating P-type ATPase [Planctomyces sp. SH-PL14]AMV20135.1 Silver exporting P-type ATPase [Planctomyces sp. SH-PL14]
MPAIAALALACLAVHLAARWLVAADPGHLVPARDAPLIAGLIAGGLPLVLLLARQALRGEFGSDLLAGLSITTAAIQGEYLAGLIVVLMLSGGETLESFAMRQASSVLRALAKRVPRTAHRKTTDGQSDIPLEEIQTGDELVVLPHEVCPVDGTVLDGRGSMDESYLTGEPYQMPKAPGALVLSGALNGTAALRIRADRLPVDSRYAKIMSVMRDAEQRRPSLRRLADQLGAWYTPLAVAIALAAWIASGDATRFLAVLVVATPCPLLIAIPVAILGGISLAARRGIIIRDPSVLERIDQCRVAIFDKTGTLTYGRPRLTECVLAPGSALAEGPVLRLAAALEQYSKHPLADAVLRGARERGLTIPEATEVREPPGHGLTGRVEGYDVEVTGRTKLLARRGVSPETLPAQAAGLECVLVIDGVFAAVLRFRDEPRRDSKPFLDHLPRHHFERVLLVSGDREIEARHLASVVGIREVYADQTPEQKLELVRKETARAQTLYMGDGINDAPALTAATVGIAFGQGDVTAEAAGAVLLESSLQRVDELLHIGHRMRTIAMQSALGGMGLSLVGMLLAASGHLAPVAGAISQEVIDVLAVLNALRVAHRPRNLDDLHRDQEISA